MFCVCPNAMALRVIVPSEIPVQRTMQDVKLSEMLVAANLFAVGYYHKTFIKEEGGNEKV